MHDEIFHLANGRNPISISVSAYDNEYQLQTLLEQYPELLRIRTPDGTPIPWVLIQREIGIPSEADQSDRWSLDHLFIDADAVPTFVEVKQGKNRESRRQVVGQMLDYAANAIAYWPIERMREAFGARCGRDHPGRTTADVLSEAFGEQRSGFDEEQFWADADANLRAGRIRMVFVADELPIELQRIIEFLTRQLKDARILGVELRPYRNADLDMLIVPRVVGSAVAVDEPEPTGRRGAAWDEARFFSAMNGSVSQAVFQRSQDLYQRLQKLPCHIVWGRGTLGAYGVHVQHAGYNYPVIRLLTNGEVSFEFRQFRNGPVFQDLAQRRAFAAQIEQLTGVQISEDKLGGIPTARIDDDGMTPDNLIRALIWFIETLSQSETAAAN